MIKDLDWKWYNFRIQLEVKWTEILRTINMIRYCNKGRHKIISKHIKHITTKNNRRITKLNLHYIKCVDCRRIMFSNRGDKRKYVRYKAQKIAESQKRMELFLRARFNKEPGKDYQVRSSKEQDIEKKIKTL